MKLAEAKRRLQVGTNVTLVWHRWPEGWREPYRSQLLSGEGVTRPVQKVQSNAVAFLTADGRTSYLNWPKASQFQSDSDSEFTILDETDGQPVMRYRIEP